MSYPTDSIEGRYCQLLEKRGVDYDTAHAFAFELANTRDDVADAERAVQTAIHDRDERIVRAYDAGLKLREVAEIVGLSFQRVAQIVNEANG